MSLQLLTWGRLWRLHCAVLGHAVLGLGEAAVHAEQGDGVGGGVETLTTLHGLQGPRP